jgi:hypothetical protein
MNKVYAMKILNISNHEPISEKILRKKYLHACLKHHPDKNINTTIPFHEIKDAYDFMLQATDEEEHPFIYKLFITLYKLYTSNVIELEPNINMLINKEVYYLSQFDLYIPLWHETVYFEEHNLFVTISPKLPNYISLDTDNNVLIHLDVSNKQIGDLIEFKYFNLEYTFVYDGLPTKVYKECGIPIIKKNIYDYDKLSDVVFTFLISCPF